MATDLPDGIDIRCCNCLSPQGLPSLADGSVDLTVTSPPYDNLRQYGGYVFDFEATAQELWRVTKPGGVVVWVVADQTIDGSETGTSFRQALYFRDVLGFKLHDTMIFHRVDAIPQNHDRYEQEFDYMFVFVRHSLRAWNALLEPCEQAGRVQTWGQRAAASWSENRRADRKRGVKATTRSCKPKGNIWPYARGPQSTEDTTAYAHPAIFPEALAADHILSWSNPGDLVLDPMVGSGTTAKMAYIHNRRFVGFDCNPNYVAIAKRRLSQLRLPV